MQNLRHSLSLLEALLTLHPCQATEDSLSTLEKARTALEHHRKLLVLEGMVKGTIIGDTWEEIVNEYK